MRSNFASHFFMLFFIFGKNKTKARMTAHRSREKRGFALFGVKEVMGGKRQPEGIRREKTTKSFAERKGMAPTIR